MKTINTITYKLPSYWASYLINNDASGLEDNEQEHIDAWTDRQRQSLNTRLFSAANCGYEYFSWSNDANSIGGEVAEYTFLIDGGMK